MRHIGIVMCMDLHYCLVVRLLVTIKWFIDNLMNILCVFMIELIVETNLFGCFQASTQSFSILVMVRSTKTFGSYGHN
jgi:hypothetical protein